ncbi:calcium-dependent phosphotriesterase [Glonium stellatum]|uniref:Calcium-dependent phosphotriesterase n=1 Tax=Glonium stellatum TaxID=574774 RepID=A0A8E2JQW2_9PEZI|nr:calcium-dependent phosphotriesterase [Glonium stellatum]
MVLTTLTFLLLGASAIVGSTNITISISSTLSYLLPSDFQGNINQNFIDTNTSDSSVSRLFSEAQKAPFIAYDPEFLDIIGPNASLALAAERKQPFASEAGVWVPDRNEVWFTSPTVNNTGYLYVLNLQTFNVYTANTSIPILNPNGGYYFNEKVYITGQGSPTQPPCLYSIDPSTGETFIVVNSYFGVRLNGPNDVTWVKRGNSSYMFFTDDPLAQVYSGGEPAQLPDAVWRYDPQDQSLVPVINRGDILVPNGIRVSRDQTKLYITDTPQIGQPGLDAAIGSWSSTAIYVYDIDEDLFPVNKRLFGLTRRGISDGIHIDDFGRVWTGESEGVVVRNKKGKVIGIFNSEVTLENPSPPLENFALAGDTLVMLDLQKIWTVKLAQTVVAPSRYYI